MIKKILILVLIALVVGFYFWPSDTKDIMDSTGHAIKETAKKTFDEIKTDDKVQDAVGSIKSDINDKIDKAKLNDGEIPEEESTP